MLCPLLFFLNESKQTIPLLKFECDSLSAFNFLHYPFQHKYITIHSIFTARNKYKNISFWTFRLNSGRLVSLVFKYVNRAK